MVFRISFPSSWTMGVVISAALLLCSRIRSTACCTFSELATSVLLRIIVPACSIWLMKNSPKFLMYILHLEASTTATALFKVISSPISTSSTAFITSESLPTPEGSIRMRSG